MEHDEIKKKILEEFLRSASPEEIAELNMRLKSRDKGFTGTGVNIDIDRLARQMSRKINEQLGMASVNIKKMAKDLVVQMAYQHKPDISERELAELVKSMVPQNDGTDLMKSISPEIFRTMISQFISFSTGSMKERELKGLPAGWDRKYWNVFTPEIRNLIKLYISGGVDTRKFWITVDYLYNKANGK